MDMKCANPICNSEYEYGHGRLMRVRQTHSLETQPAHWHGVKHFWLCASCSGKFTIEIQKGIGVLLMERLEEGAETRPSCTLLEPEIAPKQESKQVLPFLSRSRARHRKQHGDLSSGTVNAEEGLEARKAERRG